MPLPMRDFYSVLQLKVFHMNDDEVRSVGYTERKAKPERVSALPAHLGAKLRGLFADVESEPVPDRLRELLDLLAAKEK